jgi:cyclophilin family peptidyl-prolyl cis-trans isomerase
MDLVRRSCLLIVTLTAAFGLSAQSTVPALSQPLPDRTFALGAEAQILDLQNYFTVPGYNSQIAQFDTTQGKFNVELLVNDAPKAVANFLNYVNRGAYSSSLIHRSVPGFVIQGGGFTISGSSLAAVTTDAPVQNEFKLSNLRGTLAMAKTGAGPDTATSQWFVNLADNSANLNNQNGGFTVFARVLGTGMTVVDAIAAVPTYDASAQIGADFSALPLTNPSLLPDNLVLVRSITPLTLYPTATGPGVLAFSSSVSSTNAVVLTASITGSTLTLTPQNPGTATITVRATDIGGDTATSTFAVTVTGGVIAPVFTSHPVSQTIATGGTVVFNVAAGGAPAPTYQWRKNGSPIGGATNATFVIFGATAADIGSYSVVASNVTGSATSNAATFTLSPTTDAGRLTNLSVLTDITAAVSGFTIGTVVGGSGTIGTKALVVRAAGPSLAAFVPGTLGDPKLDLFVGQTVVATNDNWGGDPALLTAMANVGAFAYASATSKDAAVFDPAFASGSYTVQVSGIGGATGTVIAEIYDATPAGTYTAATPRLINVSVLKQISPGGSLTAGFTIGGSTAKTVLIRAIGPALGLTPFNIPGAMIDPQFTLFDSHSTAIASNNDWGGDPQLTAAGTRVGAFAIAGSSSKDAMLLVTLSPGGYTATASGVGGAGGYVIVEVYEVP